MTRRINLEKLQRLQLDLRVAQAGQRDLGEQIRELGHHVRFGDASDLDRAELAALRKRDAEIAAALQPQAALVRNLERFAADEVQA